MTVQARYQAFKGNLENRNRLIVGRKLAFLGIDLSGHTSGF
jgi:hypothetical protein